MRPELRRWSDRRSLAATDLPPTATLLAAKGAQRVSVVLPARNEASTVAGVVAAVRPSVAAGLVDDLLVLDAGSTDDTAARAAAAGARVLALADVLPAHGTRTGKGESLWKALAATDGDLVVYLDADLVGVGVDWVPALLWPLLLDPGVSLVKAAFDRPLALPGRAEQPGAGGRVTELMARPLLDLLWPDLAGFVQPLAGEYAARRSLLETLPFAGGYAVELGLLVDALAAVGPDGLAQVDLGTRRHRHQDTAALGRMAAGIAAAALARAGVATPGATLTQFTRTADGFAARETPVGDPARPPMVTVPEYAALRRADARSAAPGGPLTPARRD